MKRWLSNLLVVLAVSAAWACQASDGSDIELFCDHLCDCTATLPSQQLACETDCVNTLGGGGDAPPGCFECLLEASCTELVAGISSNTLCVQEC